MYTPAHFQQQDQDTVFDLVDQNGFGLLITSSADQPQVTHIPFVLDRGEGPSGTLYGHVARGNPHWTTIAPSSPALVVFQGPHSYVSPTWYANQSLVPTWNYTAVHLTGPVEIIHDPRRVLDIVTRLTEFYERGREPQWRVDNAANLDKMLGAIVGLKIPIESIQAKFKLSQNRSRQDRQGVVDALARSEDPAVQGVAGLMQPDLQDRKCTP